MNMKQSRILILVAALIGFTFIMNSCTKESSEVVTENYVTTSLDQICSETRTSFRGCFELVFPVTIVFPDESTQEVNSYEEMKASFKTWKEANPEVKGRPSLQYPYSVTTEDGTIVNITDKEKLKETVAACKITGDGPGKGGGKDHFKPCFTPVFPFKVNTPNGEVEVADKAALKALLKSIGVKDKKISFVFPIQVTLKDGTLTTVNNADELKALKDACKKG
jgi:ABC-type lipoprotein release transport system permease subunit